MKHVIEIRKTDSAFFRCEWRIMGATRNGLDYGKWWPAVTRAGAERAARKAVAAEAAKRRRERDREVIEIETNP